MTGRSSRAIWLLPFLVVALCVASCATLAPGTGGSAPGATSLVTRLTYEVVSRRPHDATAWTQGLVMDQGGRLFESTGRVGLSSLREVDPRRGRVIRQVAPPDEVFAEGLALVDGRLIQLTWHESLAYAWDAQTFELLSTWTYDGEGWGLCFDEQRLVMSDGSSRLVFRDALTFEDLGGVEVTLDGRPLPRLNELECVGDRIWANVWETDQVVRIDPATGRVDGVLLADGLLEPHPARTDPGAVLNGIAFDARTGTYLLTGKLWPELIEVVILESDPAGTRQ